MVNSAHVHLVIVHARVVGCVGSLALLLLGQVLRAEQLLRLGYASLVGCALLGGVAYHSGQPAFELLEGDLGRNNPYVEAHAVVSRAAFVGLIVLGAAATQALLQFLQGESPSAWLRWTLLAATIATIATTYTLGWSAHLGWAIAHGEAREFSPPVFPNLFTDAVPDSDARSVADPEAVSPPASGPNRP